MGQVTKGHVYPLSIRGVRLLCDIKREGSVSFVKRL